jgi:hypothetical protein
VDNIQIVLHSSVSSLEESENDLLFSDSYLGFNKTPGEFPKNLCLFPNDTISRVSVVINSIQGSMSFINFIKLMDIYHLPLSSMSTYRKRSGLGFTEDNVSLSPLFSTNSENQKTFSSSIQLNSFSSKIKSVFIGFFLLI